MQANDQLRREMSKGRVFVGYEEPPLTFPPTYKFDKGQDSYDSSAKQRVPSWTVRLESSNSVCVCGHGYNRCGHGYNRCGHGYN
eukprot:7993543-Pyramimonas_sp.AAC.2